MKKIIFVTFLFLKFSSSQITFPDAKNPTTTFVATTETISDFTEMTEEEENEEVPTEPEFPTVMPETNPPTDMTEMPTVMTEMPTEGSLDICAAMNQCFDIGGTPMINMTGKMDVRVNNVSKVK